MPIGNHKLKQVDVRIIAATNRDLAELRKQGLIRDDFFYRVYVIVIHLPPLRERKEDIPLLVDHFWAQYNEEETPSIIPGRIMEALLHHDWPGNVRELQNTLQRYLAGERLEFIDPGHTASMKRDGLSGIEFAQEELRLRQAVETFEKRFIARILEQNHGHTRKTAELLGIPLTTLYRKIKKYRL